MFRLRSAELPSSTRVLRDGVTFAAGDSSASFAAAAADLPADTSDPSFADSPARAASLATAAAASGRQHGVCRLRPDLRPYTPTGRFLSRRARRLGGGCPVKRQSPGRPAVCAHLAGLHPGTSLELPRPDQELERVPPRGCEPCSSLVIEGNGAFGGTEVPLEGAIFFWTGSCRRKMDWLRARVCGSGSS